MTLCYEIKKYPQSDGELRPYLTHHGVPLVLPNLWVAELAMSTRPNTLEAYLRDVKIAYEWANKNKLEIESRLSSFKGFLPHEITGLAKQLAVTNLGKPASAATCARRCESVKKFLEFGFFFFTETKKVSLLEQAQIERIKTRQLLKLGKQISFNSNKASPPRISTDLDAKDLSLIESVIHPDSATNPFENYEIRFRNYCIYHVILETLARRGELALIELSDLALDDRPTITIKPPNRANQNHRKDGASLKTNGRTIPISCRLRDIIVTYIESYRDIFLVPRRPCTSLFVSARDGRRLSSYSLNRIFQHLADCEGLVTMTKRIHPHGLRSTAANLARRKIAEAGDSSGLEMVESLSYLGGWVQGSAMVQHYTKSSISEQLGRVLRSTNNNERGGNDD